MLVASLFELPKASVILSCLGWTVVSLSSGAGSMSKILTDLAGDEIAPSSPSVAVERAVGGDEGALSPRCCHVVQHHGSCHTSRCAGSTLCNVVGSRSPDHVGGGNLFT